MFYIEKYYMGCRKQQNKQCLITNDFSKLSFFKETLVTMFLKMRQYWIVSGSLVFPI